MLLLAKPLKLELNLGTLIAMFNLATMYAGMRLDLGSSVTSPMLTAHLVSAMLSCS